MIDVFVERNDTATWGRVPKAGGMTLEKGEGVEGWADTGLKRTALRLTFPVLMLAPARSSLKTTTGKFVFCTVRGDWCGDITGEAR